MRECILKARNYAEYELCRRCLSRNSPKTFRTAILIQNLLMDVLRIPLNLRILKNTSGWVLLMRQHSKKCLVEVNPPQSWHWKTIWYYSRGCCDDSWSCEQRKKYFLKKDFNHAPGNICYHCNTWVMFSSWRICLTEIPEEKHLKLSDSLNQI